MILARAAHRSKRQIEALVAELAPRPDVAAVMRKLPERRGETESTPASQLRPDGVATTSLQLPPDGVASSGPDGRRGVVETPQPELRPDGVARGPELRLDEAGAAPPSGPARSARVAPLAPGRYRVQFTASAELHDKLERLQALMRSSVPDGDLAAIIEQAVTEKLQRLESRRFARSEAPRKTLEGSETSPRRRQIPAAVKRAVYERDGGRCRYVDEQGRRCTARQGLEFHHRHPFACGGDHSVDNVSLACRAHNGYLAEVDFGRKAMALHRLSGSRRLEPTPSP